MFDTSDMFNHVIQFLRHCFVVLVFEAMWVRILCSRLNRIVMQLSQTKQLSVSLWNMNSRVFPGEPQKLHGLSGGVGIDGS